MTETEWLASIDPAAMLRHLATERITPVDGHGWNQEREKPLASDRQLRLFAVACADLFWLPDHYGQDGQTMINPRAEAARRARQRIGSGGVSGRWTPAGAAHLLRDIVGNPFRPAMLPPGPRCSVCGGIGKAASHCERCGLHGHFGREAHPFITPTVLSLAQAAYDHRDPATGHMDPLRLAVLADALEEAGCDNETVLSHLRSPGPHVRGCWALDLILSSLVGGPADLLALSVAYAIVAYRGSEYLVPRNAVHDRTILGLVPVAD
jgi:hypothetical protein